jgi:hypothetical protein
LASKRTETVYPSPSILSQGETLAQAERDRRRRVRRIAPRSEARRRCFFFIIALTVYF